MDSRAKEPVVIREQDVKPFVSPLPHHRTIRVLLSPQKSPVATGVAFGVVEVGPGQVSPPHYHETEQEAWYVISGSGTIRVGDKTFPVEAGTVVVSPPQLEHQITNPGPEVFKAIFMFSPAGPETALFAE
ncbi:MAG TPA: cupin domain-containing protein [Chloroflexota bacterium]|nr:cupin domain-containing protein [Chloroflexota bacterium]